MARENLSRRRFLSDVAAGSTGAALATMPGVLAATDAGMAPAATLSGGRKRFRTAAAFCERRTFGVNQGRRRQAAARPAEERHRA